MAFEFTYQAQVAKWLTIQPDVQFIINPGGTQDLNNALVIGARAVIAFSSRAHAFFTLTFIYSKESNK